MCVCVCLCVCVCVCVCVRDEVTLSCCLVSRYHTLGVSSSGMTSSVDSGRGGTGKRLKVFMGWERREGIEGIHGVGKKGRD